MNLKENFFISLIIVTILGLFLSGCTTFSPQQMGISDAEWKSYGKEKQAKLLADYQEIYAEHYGKKTPDANSDDSDINQTDLYGNNFADGSLQIKISGGTAMLPPFVYRQAYQPAEFVIAADECQNVMLSVSDNTKPAALRVCYKNNILALDPSAFDKTKKDGTVTINYSPLWVDGFTYKNINSDGLVRLKNAAITIKKVS